MSQQRWTRVPMDVLEPGRRTTCFDEVNLGYSLEEVLAEADRCLQCPNPACESGCPNQNPIRDFIGLVQAGRFVEAAKLDWERNAVPSCTGRVCAWEKQCEAACVVNKKGEGVRIGAIERFMVDYALTHMTDEDFRDLRGPERVGRVAIIGAGPAGLTVAHFLAREGIHAEVFDAWLRPGGVMSYGIPEFVLPQEAIDQEAYRLERMGVVFHYGVRVGRDMTVPELLWEFDAVFLGVGANQAQGMGIPGEGLKGVYTAKEYLMRASYDRLGEAERERLELRPLTTGRKVLVIGAGNTAMDAARTALRLGAESVKIVYRRSEEQSPSRPIEIEHAKTEGVEFEYLVNPVEFIGEAGRLTAARCMRMRLGAPDRSGRPRPEPIEGSEFELPADTVILAVGYGMEKDVAETTPGLETDKWGGFPVDAETGQTNLPGVFAGGDAATGANTVVHAVAGARRASRGIVAYLKEKYRDEPSQQSVGAR